LDEANYISLEMAEFTKCEKPFKMGKYLVTQKLWEAVMNSNPSFFKDYPMLPVETVSWDDVQEFIKRLNVITGKTYKLPTEYEWMLCSQVDNTIYSGSDDIDKVAWYAGNSEGKTHPIGLKKPNSLGLYDMSGNVWEWCATKVSSSRVYRGGSWDDAPRDCRAALRYFWYPSQRGYFLGFRLAMDM